MSEDILKRIKQEHGIANIIPLQKSLRIHIPYEEFDRIIEKAISLSRAKALEDVEKLIDEMPCDTIRTIDPNGEVGKAVWITSRMISLDELKQKIKELNSQETKPGFSTRIGSSSEFKCDDRVIPAPDTSNKKRATQK